MSGVCGLLLRDGQPVERAAIERMVDALSHWGPDATGVWTGEGVGLGHVMLHTGPESLRDSQPWLSADGQLAITADARIDNRDELCERLAIPVAAASTLPDGALIGRAYEKWSTECPAFLVGDFAFALWDARERQLFCARDFIGVKPFYYFESRDRFLFGTEIKAIFASPGPSIPRRLNDRVVLELLIRWYGDGQSSIYDQIQILPAAHSLIVSARGTQRRRYWSPDAGKEVRFHSEHEYLLAYRDLIGQAVECRTRSHHPVVSTLSDGVDSTAVTWFARRAQDTTGTPVVGLSWASHANLPREDESSEQPPIAVADVAGIPRRYVYVDPATALTVDDRLVLRHDGPLLDRRFYVMRETFARAAACDARVILFGLGGDEVATSFAPDYLLALLFRGRLVTLAREIHAQARVTKASAPGIIRRELIEPLLRSTARELALTHTGRARPGVAAESAASSELLGRVPRVTLSNVHDAVRVASAFRDPVRANQIALAFTGRLQHAMETRYCLAGHFRLDTRFPMLDRRLVEFCLALPAEQHRSNGWQRRLVRRALAQQLPQQIRDNPRKVGGDIGNDWSVHDANEVPIRESFARWRSRPEIGEYIELTKLERLFERCRSRDRSAISYFERGFLLASFLDRQLATHATLSSRIATMAQIG